MNEITPGKVTIDAGADTPSACEKLDELKFEGDGDDISAVTRNYSMNSERTTITGESYIQFSL